MNITFTVDTDFLNLYNSTNEQLLDIEGIQQKQLNVLSIDDNIQQIDENANVSAKFGKLYGSFQSQQNKPIQKLRGYNDLYKMIKHKHGVDTANECINSIFSGDLYLHDSCSVHIPYCWATSVSMIAHNGIQDNEQLNSFPPKKRRSFIDMVKEFTIQLSHEIAGAIALSDLFVYYAYYIMLELDIFRDHHGFGANVSYVQLLTSKLKKEIEDDFQSLVHTLNMKLRSVAQSPFTNVSIFDMANLKLLFGNIVYPNNSTPDFDLIMEIQKIFCNWFSKGDPNTGLPYRFPVCTLNIRIDENKNVIDKDTFNYFCQINMCNSPFNVYISSGHKIASCCRLLSSYENHFDSLGNGGTSLGSVRVCTINLPRLGHLCRQQSDTDTMRMISEKLDETLEKCEIILRCHRHIIENLIQDNFLPFFSNGTMDMNRMFCTIGINGIYECVKELVDQPLSDKGILYYKHILGRIHNYAENISKSGILFNCEEVPAESLAGKFAQKDKIIHNMNYDIYSNQFVPLSYDIDLHKRIAFEGQFSKYLSGGCITHINMMDRIQTINQMKDLMVYIIQSGVEHYAINYNFCICNNKHVTTNQPGHLCKQCDQPVQEYTRIIGYFVPVSQFSKDRAKEHKNRKFY